MGYKPRPYSPSDRELGLVHFSGLGGIGMSALAILLKARGINIQGSDITENNLIKKLKESGTKIYTPQSNSYLSGVTLIVRSSAVSEQNPEIVYAKENNIPVIHRSELLAWLTKDNFSIAITGTHGKSTTTYLVGELLSNAGIRPSIINGAIDNKTGSNVAIGASNAPFVMEADESDASFLNLPHEIAVLTNIEPEHLDFYGSFEDMQSAFAEFMSASNKTNIVCSDEPILLNIAKRSDKEVITYGKTEADIQLESLKPAGIGYEFDISFSKRIQKKSNLPNDKIYGVKLPLYGEYNVINALGAISVGITLGITDPGIIKTSFTRCEGINRRFTCLKNAKELKIFDDYAHHPTEIKACIKAAKTLASKNSAKLIAIMQPHRYSRLAHFMSEFSASLNEADKCYVLPVYSAGEEPIPNISSKTLVNAINLSFSDKASYVEDKQLLIKTLNEETKVRCIVVFLGAGDITKIAQETAQSLKEDKNAKKFI